MKKMNKISNKIKEGVKMCVAIKEAKEKALHLRDELKIKNEKIDLGVVVKYLEKELHTDIKLIRFDFDDLAEQINEKNLSHAGALVIKNKNEYKIAINSKKDYEFQRFSIAHEIGHILLNHLDDNNRFISFHINYNVNSIDKSLYKESDYYMKEQAANVFALNLLIPLLSLDDKNEVFNLANKYNVSLDAIEAKINLDNIAN